MITRDTDLNHMKERKCGYLEALLEHNRRFEPDHLIELEQGFRPEDMEKAFNLLLGQKEPINVIYVITNRLGIYSLKYINQQKRIPEELAVVSFDETEFFDYSVLLFLS